MRWRQLRERAFWTSFSVSCKRDYYWGDRSQTWTVRLVGFYRGIDFSYTRPWSPPGNSWED